jgi:hypothetical protein
MNTNSSTYEVLSPWADADPKLVRGINPRIENVQSKTIGLFQNTKRSAGPMLEVVERRLKEKYSGIKTSWYKAHRPNEAQVETERKAEFEQWLSGVDAVIGSQGD